MMYAGGPGGDPTWGLMGNVAPSSPMTGLMGQPQNWSQVAYQMAGTPNQNPFIGLTLPPASTAATTPAGGGATALGGTLLGLLGSLVKGPGGSGASSLGNALSGLLGGSFTPDASIIGDAGAQTAADSAAQLAAANTDAGDLAAASNQQWLDSLGGAAPAAAADAAPTALAASDLAPVGVDAATAAPTVTGLDATAGAGDAAGAQTAGLGATAGAGAAIGLAALPAILAMTIPDSLKGSYYQNMNQTLAAGPGTTPQQIGQYYGALDQASASNDPRQLAMLQQLGIQPAQQGLLSNLQYSGGLLGRNGALGGVHSAYKA